MSIKECNLTWDTGKQKKTHNLLKDDYLDKVGIKNTSEIKEVRPFFAFHEHPYTEEGIASNFHPLVGSGGAEIETYDGETALIEEIYYYDYGHKSGDLKDTSHYNIEGRFTHIDGKKSRTSDIEDHVIQPATEYIDLCLVAPSGHKRVQRISGW